MNLHAALDFLKDEMSLPDDRRLRHTLPADPWIEEKMLVPIFVARKA